MASGGILSQLNLLLEGSCSGELADLALSSHYAHRKVPVRTISRCTTSTPVAMQDCGGWLYIADPVNRALGHSALYREGPVVDCLLDGSRDWQTTVFPSVNEDPLLYLACCRLGGYFSAFSKEGHSMMLLKSHQVVDGFWKKNLQP